MLPMETYISGAREGKRDLLRRMHVFQLRLHGFPGGRAPGFSGGACRPAVCAGERRSSRMLHRLDDRYPAQRRIALTTIPFCQQGSPTSLPDTFCTPRTAFPHSHGAARRACHARDVVFLFPPSRSPLSKPPLGGVYIHTIPI